jgi:hypothetical protein
VQSSVRCTSSVASSHRPVATPCSSAASSTASSYRGRSRRRTSYRRRFPRLDGIAATQPRRVQHAAERECAARPHLKLDCVANRKPVMPVVALWKVFKTGAAWEPGGERRGRSQGRGIRDPSRTIAALAERAVEKMERLPLLPLPRACGQHARVRDGMACERAGRSVRPMGKSNLGRTRVVHDAGLCPC